MLQKIKEHFEKNIDKYFFGLGIFLALSFFIWFIFISDYLKNFLLYLQDFIQNHKEYAYWVAFISAIVEGTILLGILPGTSYVVTMGVFMARGDVEWYILFPLVIIGGFIGDSLGYGLGHLFSDWMKKKYGNDHNYKFAEDFIEKHGGKSVFLARFISGIKEFVPFIAGILKMPFKKFAFWNFLGAIGWAILWIGVGWIGGSLVEKVETITRIVGSAFLIFFLISIYIYYRRNKDNLFSSDVIKDFIDEV